MYNKKLLAEMVLKSRPKSGTNAELVDEIIERSDYYEVIKDKGPTLSELLQDFKEGFKRETGMSIEEGIE